MKPATSDNLCLLRSPTFAAFIFAHVEVYIYGLQHQIN